MPDRISIIGNAGGGKSLFALRIGRALGIPVRVLDDVQWQPGWTRATPEVATVVRFDRSSASGKLSLNCSV